MGFRHVTKNKGQGIQPPGLRPERRESADFYNMGISWLDEQLIDCE
jgi:hypothetical protein